jgi:hypothetical protein
MIDFHLRIAGDRWELTEEDHPERSAACSTKDEAIGMILGLLRETPGSLKIHRRDGSVEEEWRCPSAAFLN